MFMVKRLIRNRLLYLAMVFLVISLIIVIFNYPVSAQSGCSVTRGKDGTATSFYNVSASCFIDYGWVAPVPHTAGNLRTSASYDYDSPIYLKNWGFRHAAVDLIGSESDPYDNNKTVRAIGPGIVKHINRLPTTYPPAYHPHPRNDSLIVIEHTATNGNKFLAYYGHAYAATNLSHLPPNNTVNKNQPIGTLVQSGSPTHLHFEINTTLDPPDWRYGPIDKFTSTPPQR